MSSKAVRGIFAWCGKSQENYKLAASILVSFRTPGNFRSLKMLRERLHIPSHVPHTVPTAHPHLLFSQRSPNWRGLDGHLPVRLGYPASESSEDFLLRVSGPGQLA